MPLEEIAGLQLAIESHGRGEPCLICVHGGFCDRHDWSAQVRALSDRYRLVTFDMPGHGESALPHEFTVAALAQALRAIGARYAVRPPLMIGHSLGVDVILEAWRQSPGAMAGLVLIEGGLVADGDPERAARAVEEKMDAVGLDAFLSAAFQQMFTPASDEKLRARVLARLQDLDPVFAREVVLSKVRWDAGHAANVLASVNVPTLLIQSTYFDDTFQRRSLAAGTSTPWTELVSQQVPDAELGYVEGVGHFPHIEAPDVVNERIRAFADRLRL